MPAADTTVSTTDAVAGTEIDLAGRVTPASAGSVRAIVAFFFLTFAWTWGLWGIVTLMREQAPGLGNALYLAGAFGPSFAAVFVTLMFTGGAGLRRWLAQCLRWRVGWRWYALSFIVPPLILLAALGVHLALGGAIPASPYADRVLIAIAQFGVIAVFGGPLGEEFGWRGYALPALTVRIGWRGAGALIGFAWALWHLPLLFMADTAQANLPITLFLISTVGLSVVMARLGVHAGFSVLPALLLHSVINWWSMIVPIGADSQAYSVVASIAILIALLAVFMPGPKTAPMPLKPARATAQATP
jgi:membrane protease YdiL (CAAX protease family)